MASALLQDATGVLVFKPRQLVLLIENEDEQDALEELVGLLWRKSPCGSTAENLTMLIAEAIGYEL